MAYNIDKQTKKDLRKERRVDKRQERKIAKERFRDTRAGEQVSGQAQKYGIDLDKLPTGPVTEGVKQQITEGIKKSVPKEIMADVEGFSESYTGPQFETTPTLDKERLKESAVRQRKARFADALTAFGAGLRGQTLPPGMLRSRQLEGERGEEFQTYRDVVQRNKQTQMAWEQQYRNDLIKFAEQKAKDKTLSPVEQKKYDMMAQELKIQKKKFRAEYGEGGFKEKDLAQKERELDLREEGKYYSQGGAVKTEKDLENDAAYQLRKKQYLLDVRKQEGKEAADKLENTIKGYETEIGNLETEKYKLEAEKKDYGWGNKDEKAAIDTQIAELDKKIAQVNKNIEGALKGAPTKTKVDEFFD